MRKGGDIPLRRALKSDTDWIVARHAALYAASDGFDATFEGFVRRVVDAYFQDERPALESGWVAEADGDRIGSIFCDATESPSVARLRLFFVEPEMRGTGVGGRLLDCCLDFARAAGYERIILWTHESHRSACALYEKRGFRKGSRTAATSFGAHMVEVDYSLHLT